MPSPFDIDKDVFKNWLEEKVLAIESMSIDDIESRIIQIGQIEFYAKQEARILYEARDKAKGRKGIAPQLLRDRDKLIENPDFKVNWDGDPRKLIKDKPKKKDLVKDLLGIDMSELTNSLKEGKTTKQREQEKPIKLEDGLDILTRPSVPKVVVSAEEIANKASSFKDRLAAFKSKSNEPNNNPENPNQEQSSIQS